MQLCLSQVLESILCLILGLLWSLYFRWLVFLHVFTQKLHVELSRRTWLLEQIGSYLSSFAVVLYFLSHQGHWLRSILRDQLWLKKLMTLLAASVVWRWSILSLILDSLTHYWGWLGERHFRLPLHEEFELFPRDIDTLDLQICLEVIFSNGNVIGGWRSVLIRQFFILVLVFFLLEVSFELGFAFDILSCQIVLILSQVCRG